jgi:Aspartyl protease
VRFRLGRHDLSYSAARGEILRTEVTGPSRIEKPRMTRTAMSAIVALLAFLPATAGASDRYGATTMTASAIFALNHHSQGALAPGTYHVVSETKSSSGDVWTAESYSNGNDFRTTVRESGFIWSYGRSGGRSWSQDANGWIANSAGFFAETDPFVIALNRAPEPASGVRVLGITSDALPRLVVEIRPNDGLVERRFYDTQTHLLVREEMTEYDGHRRGWEYSGYASEYGEQVAHSVTFSRDGVTISQHRILKYERLSGDPPSLAMPASRALFDLGDRDAAEIPAQFTNHGIIVPVTIENRTLDFLLDSGSSDLLIDPDVARELGMQSSGKELVSFAGDFTMANARAPGVTIGPLSATNVAMSTASFEEQLPGRRVVGLLGTDFIASGALEIDFDKERMTLHRSVPPNLSAQGWAPLSLRLDSTVPMLKAAFGGREGNFVVDLGADSTTLFPHYFAKFPNMIPANLRHEEEMETLGGKPFGITHLTMKSMVLGDWVFGGVQVVVPSESYAQQRDYDGLIGREVLSSFDLIFDYANHQLWFKPIDPNAR